MKRLTEAIDGYIEIAFVPMGEKGNGCPYIREEDGVYRVWLLG